MEQCLICTQQAITTETGQAAPHSSRRARNSLCIMKQYFGTSLQMEVGVAGILLISLACSSPTCGWYLSLTVYLWIWHSECYLKMWTGPSSVAMHCFRTLRLCNWQHLQYFIFSLLSLEMNKMSLELRM